MNDDAKRPADGSDDPSRRSFVKGAVAVGAFIALDAIGGVTIARGSEPHTKPSTLAEGVIFPDPTLCIGCLTCEVICSRVHREQGLSAIPRIRIFNDPATQVDPAVQQAYPGRGSFHQEVCLQCPTAECLYVCPVDAFTKCDLCYWRPEGPACVEACPINVRIKQGVLKSDRMCLSAPQSEPATWDRLRAFQTFEGSPAKGKA